MKKNPKTSTITTSTLLFGEQKVIQENIRALFNQKTKVLVAVSGGADSMLTAVLLYHFFIKQNYDIQNLYFVHFNHKIRDESTKEEKFVKQYFQGTHIINISKLPHSKGGMQGGTKESTLRNRRYQQIQKLRDKHNIDFIALGHNLSDRIESTFLNVLRGASLKGFLSMSFSQEHPLLSQSKVLRPLISLNKNHILEICNKNNIPFVTDQSNFDNETSIRNKLRNNILPQLFELNKNKNSRNTFENSFQNIYQEIEKTQTKKEKNILTPIAQAPERKAKFAYLWDIKQKAINTENTIEILNSLGIFNNISSKFLLELTKFLQTAEKGYKYFQKTYFFVSHKKIYIISAPVDFRKSKIIRKKYKGKTRNQYCITQKIPVFWRNFVSIIEKDNKIIKVIKPNI